MWSLMKEVKFGLEDKFSEQIRTYVDMYVFIYIARLSTLSRNLPYGRIFGQPLVGCSHKIVCFDDICCRFLNSVLFNPRPPHDVHRERERGKNTISKRYQLLSN